MGSKVENEKLFQLAVEAVLNGWTALQVKNVGPSLKTEVVG